MTLRSRFARRRAAACAAALLAALPAPGCGTKWTALPEGDQRPVGDFDGLTESRADVDVRVMPAKLPVDDDPGVLGFTIEVTNWRSEPIVVGLAQIVLRDEEGRLIRPLSELALRERFGVDDEEAAEDAADVTGGAAVEGATVLLADYRPFRSLRRYHGRRHCFHDRYYYGTYRYWYDPWYYPYGYYYGPGYGGSAYDSYYELERRRDVMRFLSELWPAATIEPEGVQRGHVLFAHPTERRDQVTLTVTALSAGEEGAEVASFEFRFVRAR